MIIITDWINAPKDITGLQGFTYFIQHKETYKYYIGKKFFWNQVKKRLVRKPTKLEKDRLARYKLNDKTKYKEYKLELKQKYSGRTKVKHTLKESDWKEYWGSSNKFKEYVEKEGKDKFNRIILHTYKTKFDCAYYELVEQINYKVLFDPDSFNEIINIRLRKEIKQNDTGKKEMPEM